MSLCISTNVIKYLRKRVHPSLYHQLCVPLYKSNSVYPPVYQHMCVSPRIKKLCFILYIRYCVCPLLYRQMGMSYYLSATCVSSILQIFVSSAQVQLFESFCLLIPVCVPLPFGNCVSFRTSATACVLL